MLRRILSAVVICALCTAVSLFAQKPSARSSLAKAFDDCSSAPTIDEVAKGSQYMQVRTQSESIDRLLFNQRLMACLLGGFAVLGVGLACIGLYGLLSYEVARRTREIGVRTALGAQRSDVLALFLRRGLIVVLLGSAAGVGAAAGMTRLLGSLLYGVRAFDPLTFLGAAVLFAVVGLLACFLPASRAMRVDPAAALRCE